uniref:Uncharacterized protein n=1 Tax=Anguilla anguilla TaxID=7936 RepID=A0A0E9XLA5_ANGAN
MRFCGKFVWRTLGYYENSFCKFSSPSLQEKRRRKKRHSPVKLTAKPDSPSSRTQILLQIIHWR